MKKTKILFEVWAFIVVVLICLLTVLGFMLNNRSKDYKKLEDKLVENAEKYVDVNFLYPSEGQELKVTKKELKDAGLLDNLEYKKDVCEGYVIVTKDKVYNYKAYIKCDKYTTKGYKK